MTPECIQFKGVTVCASGTNVLDDVHGCAFGGELLAIMGPSGSGKTCLLNFLSCRKPLMGVPERCLQGLFLWNGAPIKTNCRHHISYAPQDYQFFPCLTLAETLNFYCFVKMHPSTGREARKQKILQVCKAMDLVECLDTSVGGDELRGLSGGEKKRACICIELLSDPRVLLLDEPTSGLDSIMALNVIQLVKNVAKSRGTIVIASIHQPTSDVFYHFDRLLLLRKGKVALFAALHEIPALLSSVGLTCPDNCSFANHIFEFLDEVFDRLKPHHPTSTNICSTLPICSFQQELPSCITNVEPHSNLNNHSGLMQHFKLIFPTTSTRNKFNANLRRFTRLANETFFNLSTLANALLSTIIAGLLWYQTPLAEAQLHTIYGLFFYMSSNVFYTTADFCLWDFHIDHKVVRQELLAELYPLWAYYLPKILSQLPWILFSLLFEWAILYWMAGMPASGYFLLSLARFFLLYLQCQAICMMLSSFGLGSHSTMGWVDLIFTLQYVIGGFYHQNMSAPLKFLQHFSAFYQSFLGQRNTIFRGNNGLLCTVNNSLFNGCAQDHPHLPYVEIDRTLGDSSKDSFLIPIAILTTFLSHILAYFNLERTLTKPAFSISAYGKVKALIKRAKNLNSPSPLPPLK